MGRAAAENLARTALLFEQSVGTEIYMAPGLPLMDRDLPQWVEANDRVLAAACTANGSRDLDRKPLLATIAPGPKALAKPELLLNRLLDYPVDGVYVQALRLDPVRDSLEKLARFVQFVHEIGRSGLPVIVGRVGAFGLVLQALGVPLFDSGLGHAEAHDLSSLNRPLTERERERRASKEGGGGPSSRVYLELLKTTLQAKHARAIVGTHGLGSRFVCRRGCCRFRGMETLAERGRQHYLWSRTAEVGALRDTPVPAMRLARMEADLRSAKETAAAVRRALALETPGFPSFGHIDRWLGLLAREQQLALTA
jgi:hypothetical protein